MIVGQVSVETIGVVMTTDENSSHNGETELTYSKMRFVAPLSRLASMSAILLLPKYLQIHTRLIRVRSVQWLECAF